jgi:hypothetical protein
VCVGCLRHAIEERRTRPTRNLNADFVRAPGGASSTPVQRRRERGGAWQEIAEAPGPYFCKREGAGYGRQALVEALAGRRRPRRWRRLRS